MNPVYAATQFFTRLLAVPGWQQQPLTDDAQAVQHSGHPGAYQKWLGPAVSVVIHLADSSALTAAMAACSAAGVATGTSAQLQRVLAYAFAALGTSYLFGGRCTAPHSPDPALHCDCSSLVQQSFLQAGLHLPRTAEQQWEWAAAGHAQIISPSQAQTGDVIYAYVAGDLLAFPTMGHTGIILDPVRHLMIDAPHTGADVRIESYTWMLESAAFHIVRYLVLI
jgi:cell wall-associated NlpC family hydrolase